MLTPDGCFKDLLGQWFSGLQNSSITWERVRNANSPYALDLPNRNPSCFNKPLGDSDALGARNTLLGQVSAGNKPHVGEQFFFSAPSHNQGSGSQACLPGAR